LGRERKQEANSSLLEQKTQHEATFREANVLQTAYGACNSGNPILQTCSEKKTGWRHESHPHEQGKNSQIGGAISGPIFGLHFGIGNLSPWSCGMQGNHECRAAFARYMAAASLASISYACRLQSYSCKLPTDSSTQLIVLQKWRLSANIARPRSKKKPLPSQKMSRFVGPFLVPKCGAIFGTTFFSRRKKWDRFWYPNMAPFLVPHFGSFLRPG